MILLHDMYYIAFLHIAPLFRITYNVYNVKQSYLPVEFTFVFVIIYLKGDCITKSPITICFVICNNNNNTT